jgi:hypothetical protein
VSAVSPYRSAGARHTTTTTRPSVRRRVRRPGLLAVAGSTVAHVALLGLSAALARPAAAEESFRRPRPEVTPAFLMRGEWADDDDAMYCNEKLYWPEPAPVTRCFDRSQARRQQPTCGFEGWIRAVGSAATWSEARVDRTTAVAPQAGARPLAIDQMLDRCFSLAGIARHEARVGVRIGRPDAGRAIAQARPKNELGNDASLLCCARESMLALAGTIEVGTMAHFEL